MNRRTLLATAIAAPFVSRLGLRPAIGAPDAPLRQFDIVTRVTLLDSPGPAQLWLPLAQSAGQYQGASGLNHTGSGRNELVQDARYGAPILRTTWQGGEATQTVEVTQRVAVRDRAGPEAATLSDVERALWLAPTESAPTGGIVRETAERIIGGRTAPLERLRALYDWVVDTTWRNPETPGCGTGDVSHMLENGQFGGKCADINGLMVALARSAGFPARDVYGVRVAESRIYPCLGKSGDLSRAQHCRAEAYVEGAGWFPLDPADVRKAVLEQNLAVDSPDVRAVRDKLFGSWEMNWVGFNSATDIELPGAGRRKPNFAFLMYPCAFTATGMPDCLNPPAFRYEITSREVAA